MDNVRYLSEVRQALPLNWQTSTDGTMWLYATAPDNPTAIQGWKVHVSSQVNSAVKTIRETVKVCVKHKTNFKLAMTPEIHRDILNSKQSRRSSANKFMTLYLSPDDPDRLTELISDLNEVLTAQNAPMVFSDLRLGPQVFMRYGAFIGVSVLQPDGTQRIMIQDPDGKVVEDKRSPFFDPPSWVTTHPSTGKPLEDPSDDDNAAIHGYWVKEALHFSSTGGVYLADKNDETVVLKEAIPNAMLLDDNQDAVDRLNKEYDMLSHLSETGYTPRPIEIFSYQNHCFLAMEYLDAPTLLQKVPLPFRDALPTASAITEAVAAIHREGVVIGDLSAKNLLFSKNGGVKIIDFEGAYHTESPPETLFATAGFAPGARAKNQKDDIFSLGSVLMTLFVGNITSLFDQANSPSDVAARFLAAAGMPKALTTLITECLSDTSEARPRASEVAARLSTLQHPLTGHSEDTRGVDADDMDIDRTFNTLVDVVAQTPFPHRERNESEGSRLGVTSGIAGITLTLDYIRKAEGTQSTAGAERFKEGCWQLLEANLNSEKCPPGFGNGLSGIAYAIHQTTDATGYAESLMQRALEHPMLSDPNFPVTLMHGQCGVGATALYFYKHSGAPAFLEGAVACAQRLKDTVDAGALLLFFALADAMRGEGREADADLWSMRGRESLESLADKPSKSGLNAHLVALAVTKSQHDFGDELLSTFAMDPWEFAKDFLPDPTLSGLSGIGLAYLHRYEATGVAAHLISAMEIAKVVSCFTYENGNGPAFPGADLRSSSAGLLGGASGVLVFLQRLREQPLKTSPFFPWEWL